MMELRENLDPAGLISLFSQNEIEDIMLLQRKDKYHPLQYLLLPTDYVSDRAPQVMANTDRAYKRINNENVAWLTSKKADILFSQDFSTAAGALGELRCYGFLLDAASFSFGSRRASNSICLKPVSTTKCATPDFEVTNKNESVIIEVHSKQMLEEESSALEQFNNYQPPSGEKITIRETVVTPCGKAKKPGENTTINVISKFCGIKQKSKQLSANKPSVFWLDLQDEIWAMHEGVLGSTTPVSSSASISKSFISNPLWYAFYGYKDAPVFIYESLEVRSCYKKFARMQHDGRFRMDNLISGVIVSLPHSTFFLENPWATNKIPKWFARYINFLPWYKFEKSKIRWPRDILEKSIQNEQKLLQAFEKEHLYTW